MKKAFRKNLFRSISNSKTRFFSIFLIIAIGVGFFAGINATEPDMLTSADHYYKDSNLFDLRIVSPLGFTDENVSQMKKVNGVETVQDGYSADLFLKTKTGNTYTIRLYSYDENDYAKGKGMNRTKVIEGRLPKKEGEIVVEAGNFAPKGLDIGSKVTLSEPDTNNSTATLKSNTYTIVGKVHSPFYISYERGQTNIGDGSIDLYAYINEKNFSQTQPTDLFIKVENSTKDAAYSKAYENQIKPVQNQLTEIGKAAMASEIQKRKDEISKQKAVLEDKKKQVTDQFTLADQKFADAEKELRNKEAELTKNEAAYNEEIAQASEKLTVSEQQLAEAKATYQKQISEWKKHYAQYEQGVQQLADTKTKLDGSLKKIKNGEQSLQEAKTQLDSGKTQISKMKAVIKSLEHVKTALLTNPPQTEQDYQTYLLGADLPQELRNLLMRLPYIPENTATTIGTINTVIQDWQSQLENAQSQYEKSLVQYGSSKQQLEQAKNSYQKGLAQYQAGKQQLAMTKKALEQAKQQLNQANIELSENEKKIRNGRTALNNKQKPLEIVINESKTKLNQAKAELEQRKKDAEATKVQAFQEIKKGESELVAAEAKIAIIPDNWFIYTRNDNPGYSDYHDDATRIGEVAKVFPLFFFLVAALVCMTTMTRMIEEERGQIGTLKAIGYGTATIASKYLIYALLSSLTGAIIGLLIGFRLFPTAIMNAYSIMYTVPINVAGFHFNYAAVSLFIALFTTLTVTIFVTLQELRSTPSTLMQPRAPKPGKRILLERITPIWSRLSFSQKVAFRNTFRYKQRFFMTVLGVAGCTALLLTGYGLSDSINDIMDKQFDEIFLYDGQVVFDSEQLESKSEIQSIIDKESEIKTDLPILSETVDVSKANADRTFETELIVPNNLNEFKKFVNLHERKSKKAISVPNNGAVITEKLANLLHCDIGDTIEFQTTENKTYKVKITAIAENYLAHYLYLSPDYYQKVTKEEPIYNTALFTVKDLPNLNEENFKERLMKQNAVLGVGLIQSTADDFKDTLDSLDFVVFILIISAGVLAVVVLYNLTNINITERIREIATIKVLGFRNHEVDLYVYRENIFLTMMGTALGLGLGVILHKYVIKTMEIDTMMFGQKAHFSSYLWSIMLTILFSLFVNIFMHFKLKRVDMVESLKSVE